MKGDEGEGLAKSGVAEPDVELDPEMKALGRKETHRNARAPSAKDPGPANPKGSEPKACRRAKH